MKAYHVPAVAPTGPAAIAAGVLALAVRPTSMVRSAPPVHPLAAALVPVVYRKVGARPVRIALLVLALATPAFAHWADLAVMELTCRDGRCRMAITLPAGLVREADGNGDGKITAEEVTARAEAIRASLGTRIALRDGGGAVVPFRVQGSAGGPAINVDPRIAQDRPGEGHVTLQLAFEPVAKKDGTVLRYDLFVPDAPNASCMAMLSIDGKLQSHVFTPAVREVTLGVAARHSFVALGVEHILTGYDHLLFLLALLVVNATLLGLLKLVTAFTVAHSITLSLAVLDIVTLPGRLVESLIALSVMWVAAENLWRTEFETRWRLTFGFGLIHGMGFASVLREIGLPKGEVFGALFGFNVGVELGQLAVVAVAYPLLKLAARAGAVVRWALSALAFLAGLVWFVQRVTGS